MNLKFWKKKTKKLAKDPAGYKEEKIWFTSFLGSDIKYFLENLSVLLAAGIDLISSLHSVAKETKSRRMKKIITNIAERVEGGEPLWRALIATEIFPHRFVSLIRVGEESGRLSENLIVVVQQMDTESTLSSKIRSALMYPAIVLPLTFIVGVGTAWFTLPKLASVFSQINVPLPLATRMLIALGLFLQSYGVVVIPLIVSVIILVIYFLFAFSKTKYLGYLLVSHLPVAKSLVQQVELARVGYIFGSLLSAGIPVVDSLQSLSDTTMFRNYQDFYLYLRGSIESGNSFQKSFADYEKSEKFIPLYVQNMIVAAEQSGRLNDVLKKVGHLYEAKIEGTIRNFSALIEPILLLVIGAIVATMALAVLGPTYNLVQVF